MRDGRNVFALRPTLLRGCANFARSWMSTRCSSRWETWHASCVRLQNREIFGLRLRLRDVSKRGSMSGRVTRFQAEHFMALFRQPSKGYLTSLAVLSGLAAAAAWVQPAGAQEPAACLSFDPSVWPAPSRPYFMLAVDTSGSMIGCTNPSTSTYQFPATCPVGATTNSCGLLPTRLNDAKCALRQTVSAFSGQVNFGLATFATYLTGCAAGACPAQCPAGSTNCNTNPAIPGGESYSCTYNYFAGAAAGSESCGNNPNCAAAGPGAPNYPKGTWLNGANVVVGLPKDTWWLPPPAPASNTAELLQWFDGQCNNNREIFARGGTPLEGILRGVTQYLRAGWTQWSTTNYCSAGLSYTFPTPADTNDRTCRSINVILVTDGDESCGGTPVNIATDLFQNGVTIGGKNWKVKTYVIAFAGANVASTDAIAAAGGTTASYIASNEVQLSNALSTILSTAAKPETCDNTDNNCNGCTDEGYKHYCDVPTAGACCTWNTLAQRTACGATACKCCNWATPAERNTCLTQYTNSIATTPPNGDLTLLPCTNATQQTQPANWLCYNPGDVCDNSDNNCQDGIDENQTKCGNPLACPTTEVCDGKDNDCDGFIDENLMSCTPCTPSPEVCDGCDNDCDGIADDGIAAQPCGLAAPPNCVGTQACKAPVAVPVGTCVAGGGLQACVTNPQPEICDMIDNDCDGVADDGVPATPCVPAGTPGGQVYGAPSQCRQGTQACGSALCLGYIGPSTEVCDGIDNDCDGQVDEGVMGVGTSCGTATPPCTPGTLQCVGGALVCQGGTQPQPEKCDGIDNNCNGTIDDSPLTDAPPAGQTGCWANAGNCCSWGMAPGPVITWCPPTGAACNNTGTLTSPCSAGTLVCSMGAWTCQGPIGPSPETCDSVDNNCDGMVDNAAGVGQPCGTDTGECVAGVSQCSANGVVCVGSVGPTSEVCDGKDNDCDGVVDDSVPGVGQPCGVNQPPCTLGTTACVGGAVVCQGGVQPTGEICDGVDNDCDGSVDDGPLADAPPPMLNGCWTLPGNCCSFGTLQWCPPPGASCSDNGMLMAPCNRGTLSCNGALGYVCSNSTAPTAEACDGLDNDCNGTVDDGMFPGEGTVCGSDEGECVAGVIDCAGGILDCVGDTGPKPELCNGLDDDCNGTVDNGIVVGGSCPTPYDTTLYPGPRDKGACQPGILQCDGMGGNSCTGGQGPQPEVCDGIDNDCDGSIDETGPAPDGIDGTANPVPPPAASIGDLCGVDTGACQQGNYACVNGQFACIGGQGPQEESCDCNDNDCDGTNDEQDPSPAAALCAGDNKCVKSGTSCLCASPCLPGEFPCPPGQRCEAVTSSDTGMPLGNYCVADNCGDCTTKTVLNADNTVLCAPAGTPADPKTCVAPPVCECKGQTGCKNPCYGVTCGTGEICTEYGMNAGKCVLNNCFAVPCQGCDQWCKDDGTCDKNPCVPSPCMGQTCVPDPNDNTKYTCVDSCAGKLCGAGEVCKNGTCVKDCPMCANGEVCDYSQMPPACVANKCNMPCANGSQCCDPITGQCGNCPCDGVVCPTDQVCMKGECVPGSGGSGGTGGTGGSGGDGNTQASSSSSGGGIGGAGDTGIWGLPTGGGGCSCDLGAKERTNGVACALAALALGILRKRTTSRRGSKEVS